MEWNCCWSVNIMSPFLFESSGDSEQVKSDVNHHHVQDHEAPIDEYEAGSLRFDEDVDVGDHDDDDDAQSCSYDHSSYINTSQHDQSQSLIYDDIEDGTFDDDDDDDNNNRGESKMMGSSKRQKRSHEFCVDSLNQREIDRQFWESCLAS